MGSPTLIGIPAAPRQVEGEGLGEGVLGVRVVVRTPTVETFIQKYSRFIKDDRIFIFTKTSQPPGTRMRFALELGDGKPLVSGEGTVTRVRAATDDPNRPPGMELRFSPIDDASRKIVALMLAERDARSAATPPSAEVPRATLPALPLTGAHMAFSSTGALPALRPEGAYRPVAADRRAASDEPVVVAAEVAPVTPPSKAQVTTRLHALRPRAPVEQVPVPLPLTAAASRTEGGTASRPSTFDSAWNAPAESRSALDADSLFAKAELPGDPADEPELPPLPNERTARTQLHDEHSFPGIAPSFAEAWRATNDSSEVPANPFSELPDDAIEYFVEWSLDRSTAPPPPVVASAIATQALLAWKAQSAVLPAISLVPVRDALRRGMVMGACFGALVGGAATWAMGRALAPTMALPVVVPDPALGPVVAAPAPPPSIPPPSIPPPAAAPLSTHAEASITSRPPGATCIVDGKRAGHTPLTLSLERGSHAVVLTLDRYAPAGLTVDAPGMLDAVMKRPSATLKVTSAPPGGSVVVDGEARGVTPLEVTVPAYEHHDVSVASPHSHSWHKKVYVRAPSTSVQARLGTR